MKITVTKVVLPLALVLVAAGCATSGRYVALKEFSAPKPAEDNSPLKGHTVCIKPFASTFNIDDKLPDKDTTEPASYTYVKPTKEEAKLWDAEVNQRKKTSTKADWPQIGYVRNGFGMVMSKVYALNDPGAWLADTLKADLEKLGATVVEPSKEADADVTVSGTIKYFKVDIYMSMWSDLIVDVQMKTKAKAATTMPFHTRAAQAAWSGSSFEYYQSVRQCQQKFSRLAIAEMEKQLKD